MTRLIETDIRAIRAGLPAYDRFLIQATGLPLRGIACCSAGLGNLEWRRLAAKLRVAVVPVTTGQGVIGGFAQMVQSILTHIGLQTMVTRSMDVAGIATAIEQRADIVFAADDDRFVALVPRCDGVVDNIDATAAGYVTGLKLMANGLERKPVLVIGCGPLGRHAALLLCKQGARPTLYDLIPGCMHQTRNFLNHACDDNVALATDLDAALAEHRFIFDATSSADVIDTGHINAQTCVAAPGMPCGITLTARQSLGFRLLHDPLELGVAAMAARALKLILDQNALERNMR